MKRILGLLLLCALLSACGADRSKKPPKEDIGHLVKTMVVGEKESSQIRSYPGRVIANKRVEMAFQVPGTIIEFPVVNGQGVVKGELLTRLDPRDYQHKLDEEMAKLIQRRDNHTRAEDLVSTGTISQAMYDEIRAKYDVSRAKTAAAQKALDDTYLRAPFTGIVAKTHVENFEEVEAKEQILSLQDISDVDIIIDVPEQDFANTKGRVGVPHADITLPHIVKFPALPHREFPVKLKEYATEANPVTQTYEITLTMRAPTDVNILPGMTANFILLDELEDKRQAFLIPVNAVAIDENGNNYVWIVNPELMRVHKRIIKVGEVTKDKIRIIDGLKIGERIVTAGVPYLENGMKVRLYSKE